MARSKKKQVGLPLVFAIGVLSSIVGGLIVVKMTGKNGG